MTPFGIARLVVYPFLFVLALAVIGCGGQVLTWDGDLAYRDSNSAMAVAAGVFTFLLLPVVVVFDRLRSNFFLSWSSVEIGWLGFLWILWLACAGLNSAAGPLLGNCDAYSSFVTNFWNNIGDISGSTAETACHLAAAVIGLSWFIWILLSAMLAWLLVIAIGAQNAGYKAIWTSSAAEYRGQYGVPSHQQANAFPMGQPGYAYQEGPSGPPANAGYGNGGAPYSTPYSNTPQYGYTPPDANQPYSNTKYGHA